MALVIWKTINPEGQAIPALYSATSNNPAIGPWQAMGNSCGDCITELGAAHYTVRITSPGYDERTLEADIGDPGIITSQLEYSTIKPTRDRIINVQGNFLNLFDAEDIPIWDAYLSTLIVQGSFKLTDWISRLRAAGTTHINLPISYNYNEPLGWAPVYPIDGMDFTKDLVTYASVVDRIQGLGFIPIIKLAFDGQGYDPNGWTYGWQWGMDNAERIINSLSAYVDTALWSTGYDGCFPNWTPLQTTQMLQKLRSILGPTPCVDTEFSGPGSVGYCHMGNGAGDWTPTSLGILDNFSVELLVYPPDSTGVQQTAARLLGGSAKNIEPKNYLGGQPPSDSNSYLHQMDGIKKINICMYETTAFNIIRKQITSAQAKDAAGFTANFGFNSFGNGLP